MCGPVAPDSIAEGGRVVSVEERHVGVPMPLAENDLPRDGIGEDARAHRRLSRLQGAPSWVLRYCALCESTTAFGRPVPLEENKSD